MSRFLLLQIRSRLKAVADAKKGPQMQSYMKSKMPYIGVPAPILRKELREIFALKFKNAEEWADAVLYIFRNAKYREEWYSAVELCQVKRAKEFQTAESLSLFEEMIVGAAWWDVVDVLASHCVGDLLRRYPKQIRPEMLMWSRSDNVWKRRTSIICQLGFKQDTDLHQLYACIRPSLASKEFFLRKAIGWALRQYAWTDPNEVQRYVREHAAQLSPLSTREALKNVSA